MMTTSTKTQNPMARVMGLRDFRLLFGGTATSLLGDQFALIATPWLVLMLTGDPMALGIVLALEGIPRAVFMLLGGAITDRISPRLVMLIADVVRLVLTGLLALAIFTGTVQVWMLYAFGLGFGLVAGFAIPAENSIVPMLVKDDDLQAGNSIIMGITYNSTREKGESIKHVAHTLGADKGQALALLLFELKADILAAIVSGFGRAISEVGAVMLVGGNIKGHTRVMTTSIAMLQSMGDYSQAIAIGLVLLALSFIINSILYHGQKVV